MRYHLVLLTLLVSVFCNSQNRGLVISGFVKDSPDTVYGVKNAKINLYTDDGNILQVSSDSNGYYKFAFVNFKFKKAQIAIETSRQTTSKIGQDGYLASKEMETFLFPDSSSQISKRKDFYITKVTVCYQFPSFKFKKNQIIYDTITVSKNDEIKTKKDSAFFFPYYTINYFEKLLKDNPTIIITINGHCSTDESSPQSLSQSRADLIKLALIQKGIDPHRIITKGFSQTRLIIKDIEINRIKDKDQKALLHSKNRRSTLGIVSWDYGVDSNKTKDKKENEED